MIEGQRLANARPASRHTLPIVKRAVMDASTISLVEHLRDLVDADAFLLGAQQVVDDGGHDRAEH